MCEGGRGQTVPLRAWSRLLILWPALLPICCPVMAERGQTGVRKGARVSTRHMQLSTLGISLEVSP